MIINMRNVYIWLALSLIGGLMALVGLFAVPQLTFPGVMIMVVGTACFPPFKRRR